MTSGPSKLAVVAQYASDVRWLARAPIPYVLIDKTAVPNVGQDASTYLYYILQNYDRLPEQLLFLHAHEVHWHHARYSELVSMQIRFGESGRHFLNVNHYPSGKMMLYTKDILPDLNRSQH